MAHRLMAREDAPILESTWRMIDETLIQVVRSQVVGRRLLPVEGPFGLGLKVVPLQDTATERGMLISKTLPLVVLQETFTLGLRDVAAFEEQHVLFDASPIAEAAISMARMEDDLILNGGPGIAGLTTLDNSCAMDLGDWGTVGIAAANLVEAVTHLDAAGFHGPYAVALAPERYNALFRLYPQTGVTELQHVQQIVTGGVFKAPTLSNGGVLLAVGRQFSSLILGLDMTVGFVGPAENELEFVITESLVPRILQPGSICVLNG